MSEAAKTAFLRTTCSGSRPRQHWYCVSMCQNCTGALTGPRDRMSSWYSKFNWGTEAQVVSGRTVALRPVSSGIQSTGSPWIRESFGFGLCVTVPVFLNRFVLLSTVTADSVNCLTDFHQLGPRWKTQNGCLLPTVLLRSWASAWLLGLFSTCSNFPMLLSGSWTPSCLLGLVALSLLQLQSCHALPFPGFFA